MPPRARVLTGTIQRCPRKNWLDGPSHTPGVSLLEGAVPLVRARRDVFLKCLLDDHALDYMAYTRGSKDDYNRYARLSGDEGWGWDRIFPYFLKVSLCKLPTTSAHNTDDFLNGWQNEIMTSPADRHDTAGQFDPALHGFNGINSVSMYGFPQPIDTRVIETTRQLSEFPFNEDYNSGFPIGVGKKILCSSQTLSK